MDSSVGVGGLLLLVVPTTAMGMTLPLMLSGLDEHHFREWAVPEDWVGEAVLNAVITLFAILGFERIRRLGGYCAPFVFRVFVLGAAFSLPKLGVEPGLSNFAEVAPTVVAGWTTANPTLYHAGLALQTVTPDWPRWRVTLVAGVVTTLFSSFPAVFLKLLDYVALYGLVLMPVGAIVLARPGGTFHPPPLARHGRWCRARRFDSLTSSRLPCSALPTAERESWYRAGPARARPVPIGTTPARTSKRQIQFPRVSNSILAF